MFGAVFSVYTLFRRMSRGGVCATSLVDLSTVARAYGAGFHCLSGLFVVRWCVTALAGTKRSLIMAVTVGDIVRITARMLLFGTSDLVNVFHFKVAVNLAVDDAAFMVDVALAMDLLYGPLNSQISTKVSYSSIEGQNITDNELLPSEPWPTLTVGGNGTEMLPEMNSACVFHRTLTPRVRAAKFLPPFGENTNLDGALAVTTVPIVQAFGDSLTAGLLTASIALNYVAFNRVLVTATGVTQALVPSRFRTQRRRRVGVGS